MDEDSDGKMDFGGLWESNFAILQGPLGQAPAYVMAGWQALGGDSKVR